MGTILKLLIGCLLLGSCGNRMESVPVPANFKSAKITSKKNQLQQILTKDMVAAVADVSSANINVHIEENSSKTGQYTILYSWTTGKKRPVANGKHEIDEYHSFSLGFVSQMELEQFERYYSTNEGLQTQVNDLPKQKHYNKEIGTIEANYFASYAGRRTIEKLENVATMAFWETPMNALHVLAKDAAFTVTANFGDDDVLAKKKSVELTNAILNP